MATLVKTTEPKAFVDVAPHVVCPHWSLDRETITGGSFTLGTVLGKITASGKFTELDPAAEDGSENAAAVLGADCDASTADKIAMVVARGAVLDVAGLVWPAGITDPQKAAALSQLKALGLVPRTLL
jgi:hypothetical protein